MQCYFLMLHKNIMELLKNCVINEKKILIYIQVVTLEKKIQV